MQVMKFICRGETFEVNFKGEINGFENWKFLGVSFHHWRKSIDISFKEIWKKPELAKGGLVWDEDYGTVRTWRGEYLGKLPRITSCWKEENDVFAKNKQKI